LFARLAKIAGPEGIICKSYHDVRGSKRGIYEVFLDALDLDAEG